MVKEPGRAVRASRPDVAVGVSSCLLGQEVRYDGGHKRSDYVVDVLGSLFRLVPVCPEVEIGMGVPRETLRLVRAKDRLRLIGKNSGKDYSATMRRYARQKTTDLEKLGLSGYILKKGSPSCGMKTVRVFTETGVPSKSDRGLFAATLLRKLPLLPIEEEDRLSDDTLRENFIVRVFAHHRLSNLFSGRWKIADLAEFHAGEEPLITSHDPNACKRLARIIASSRSLGRKEVSRRYSTLFMTTLASALRRNT